MNILSVHKDIGQVLDIYRDRLDNIPDERFTETPPGGDWSYAEVYSHILQATLGSSILLEKCTLSSCRPTLQKPTLLGLFVLTSGRFPLRVKAPNDIAAKIPAVKISKEEAKNLLIKCRKRIDHIIPLVKNASPKCRYPHSRLGMLNAKQWFKFIIIHAKHHLKQLDRIQKEFHS